MIKVSGITKTYGDTTVVEDVSFDVDAGRVTGFVGPNGAGKSTTMRTMVGLTNPDRGEVRYAGVRYSDLLTPARVIGSVLDAKCMHPGRTARNHLKTMAVASRIPVSRVDDVLATVGLEQAANKRAGNFSLGMRQRLALAGALLGDPEVLMLDEPANGLDPDGIRWLRNYLRGFADDGGAVFVSSHLISELSQFADDLVVIGAGRILASDTVAAISDRSEKSVLIRTPQITDLELMLAGSAPDAQVSIEGDRFLVTGVSRDVLSDRLYEARIQITELTDISRSLEDELIDMTAASAQYAAA